MPRRFVHPALVLLLVLGHLGEGRVYTFLESVLWTWREAVVAGIRGRGPVDEVVLVLVDEQDLQAVPSRWPWNRRLLAEGLRGIRQAGAAGLGVAVDLGLQAASGSHPEADAALLQELGEAPGVVYLGGGPGEARQRERVSLAPAFQAAFREVGSPRLGYDARGRLVRLGLAPAGQGLGALLALAGHPEARDRLRASLDAQGAVRLPFHLAGRFPHLAWRDLARPEVRARLSGRLVLLGARATVLHDLVETPVDGSMPRAEALALVLAGALRDQLVRELPPALDLAMILAVTLMALALGRRLEAPGLALAAAGGAGAWGVGALMAHALGGVVVPLLRPPALLALLCLLEVLRQRSGVVSDLQVTDPMLEPEARRRLDEALAAMASGDYAEAARELADIAQMETLLRARAEQRLVLALLALDRTMEAAVLVGALEFDKLEAEEVYLLARELEARDLKEEAKRVFERLYLIDPDFQDVRTRLAELRHELSGFTEDELVETIARRILDRRFDDVRLHAKGGMGFVFRVRDKRRRGTELALKILSPLSMNDPMVVTRFLREARAVAALQHPNLIRVHDVFRESLPYYTMEFFDAPSLMERMQAAGRLAPDEVVPALLQVCAGLGYAHEHGLVHRDVKPHNLLVATDGRVKVIDFGAAHLLSGNEVSATGTLVGTPLYMAPEQVRGQGAVPATDVFGLALVLHEALYGTLPFASMAARLEHAAPRPPPEEGIPEALVEVMMRALAPEVEDRYASMEALARDLEPIQAQLDEAASGEFDTLG